MTDSEKTSSFTTATPFRVLLGGTYFLLVNLLAGLIAETFGYPSLWGNSSGIFGEYAIPMLFTWAFAHWLTMLPATLLVMGLPRWDMRMLVIARWCAIATLVVCFGIELSERFGRFQKIPFVLFVMVDAGIFLLISVMFKPPVRVLLGLLALIILLPAAWFFVPAVITTLKSGLSQNPQTIDTATPDSDGLIADVDLVIDWHYDEVIYYMEIAQRVEPGQAPLPDEICHEARSAYRLALEDMPPPAELSAPTVQFMARAWFDASDKYLFPAGTASLTASGEWQCQFKYPEPEVQDSNP